jgi:hypothetical protein
MKIKGAIISGPNKGKPALLSDTELVVEAVKDCFCKRAAAGTIRLVYGVTVSKIDVTTGRTGMTDAKLNDPRTIIASGTISYKINVQAGDRLKKADPVNFNIKFKDGKDEHGLPDVEIIDYKES